MKGPVKKGVRKLSLARCVQIVQEKKNIAQHFFSLYKIERDNSLICCFTEQCAECDVYLDS